MKLALVTCPFFTNGDWPPLGLSCINGALREEGIEPVCFDFNFTTYKDNPDLLHLLYHMVSFAGLTDRVVFVLRPELILNFLYKEDYPDFKWPPLFSGPEAGAGAMLYLGMKAAAREQARTVLSHKPAAALFSTYISNMAWSLLVAKWIKKLSPKTPVVFGGPGVGLPEVQTFLLAAGFVDALAVGEGEMTVAYLAHDLEAALAGDVPGVAVMKHGAVKLDPRPSAPLQDIPLPSFAGLPLPGLSVKDYAANRPNKYRTPFFHGLPVYSSRGCVNRCAYCSETAYWKGYRLREPGAVVDEIQRISEETGESHFLFGDSAVNGRPAWLIDFLEAASSRLGYPSLCAYMMARPELDAETAKLIKRAGFGHVVLGVETFSGRLRHNMNKRHGDDELFDAILNLTRAGVHVKSNLLVGFPGETEEDFEVSLSYIRRWRETPESEKGPGTLFWDAGHPVRLEAYSDLYNNPGKHGIVIEDSPVPPLPDGLSRVAEAAAHLFKNWCAPGREDLSLRAKIMREEAARK